MTETVQWVLLGLSVPILILFIISIIKRSRELGDAIEKYKKEQEESGGAQNPYAGMAEIYGPADDMGKGKEEDHKT